MTKIFIFLMIFCLHQSTALPQLFDSMTEAQVLLETLFELTTGYIGVGKLQVDDLLFDLGMYGHYIFLNTRIAIQINSLNYQDQLQQLKQFAAQNQQNISSCLDDNELKLNQLPEFYINSVESCLDALDDPISELEDGSKYRIDVLMTDAMGLNFDLSKCGAANETCLSNVVVRIKDLTMTMENKVQAEITQLSEDVDIVRGVADSCSDTSTAGFSADSVKIITEISECIA